MRTKCHLIRVEEVRRITEKCFVIILPGGAQYRVPARFVFEPDDRGEGEAWWIGAWIIEKEKIPCSRSEVAWFEDGKILPSVKVEKHRPVRRQPVENELPSLFR